jgi:hypothetical protein
MQVAFTINFGTFPISVIHAWLMYQNVTYDQPKKGVRVCYHSLGQNYQLQHFCLHCQLFMGLKLLLFILTALLLLSCLIGIYPEQKFLFQISNVALVVSTLGMPCTSRCFLCSTVMFILGLFDHLPYILGLSVILLINYECVYHISQY